MRILFILLIGGFLISCQQDGCTDPTATNYDPNADNNDGSCQYASTAATCANFSSNLIDVWNVGTFEYTNTAGGSWIDTGFGNIILFNSDGTYQYSQFTFAWFSEPRANEADSGTWSYNETSEQLTLISTKSQIDSNGDPHSNNVVIADILSCSSNEVIFQFVSQYGNDVRVTLLK